MWHLSPDSIGTEIVEVDTLNDDNDTGGARPKHNEWRWLDAMGGVPLVSCERSGMVLSGGE